jgi:hypothetical protein
MQMEQDEGLTDLMCQRQYESKDCDLGNSPVSTNQMAGKVGSPIQTLLKHPLSSESIIRACGKCKTAPGPNLCVIWQIQ